MWLVYDFKEHGVDLEVEGVRYYRDAYVMNPPPSRGGDLELEGGVMHVTSSIYTNISESRDSYVRGTE